MSKAEQRTCKCGWVAFAVTRAHAEAEVARFNEFFEQASLETRSHYGNKPASIALYERCQRCGGSYRDFRPSNPGDCPDGCTLSPIIREE